MGLGEAAVGLLRRTARAKKDAGSTAAVTEPAHVLPQYPKPPALLADSLLLAEPVLAKVRKQVEPVMTQRDPIEAEIIDDTSLPKQGRIQSPYDSYPMEEVVSYGRDAELKAMKSIDAAITPRPTLGIDAKKDKPADLPQVACGGRYL
jgi:hypothetical protein